VNVLSGHDRCRPPFAVSVRWIALLTDPRTAAARIIEVACNAHARRKFYDQWLEAQRPEVLPKSPMGKAIGYALNNRAAQVRYTVAGFLPIDNNVAEREMKRITIGRKSWLTVGSPRGGQTAAVLFSFTSTYQRLGIEPWAYLKEILTCLPTTASERLDDLLPDRWQTARADLPAKVDLRGVALAGSAESLP
jgi:hypothetical protein